MTEEKTITTRLCIPFEKIPKDKPIVDILKEELLQRYKLSADKDIGYIEEILEIIRYTNIVSRVYNTVDYSVTFLAKVIHPKEGTKIVGKVVEINMYGIILSYGLIQMMVRRDGASTVSCTTTSTTNGTSGTRKANKEVKINDEREVYLQTVTYNVSSKIYMCIGVFT